MTTESTRSIDRKVIGFKLPVTTLEHMTATEKGKPKYCRTAIPYKFKTSNSNPAKFPCPCGTVMWQLEP